MRVRRSIFKPSPLLLIAAVPMLFATVARSVLDDSFDIEGKSTGYEGSHGYVEISGTSNESGVDFACVDSDNDFSISCRTDHPDMVLLSTNQGKVHQTRKGNNAAVTVEVIEMGGIAVGGEFTLSCETAQLTSKVNVNTNRGEVECRLKNCDIPGGLAGDQIASALDCIHNAVDNDDLGRRVQTLELSSDEQISGKIKTRGGLDVGVAP